MTIPLYFSGTPLSFNDIAVLPSFPLELEWWGKRAPHAIEIRIAADPEKLFFAASANVPASCKDYEPGSFVEGLWNEDVVELFLKDDSSGAYQEINLSPGGAWWTVFFDSYRARNPFFRSAAQAVVQTRKTNSSWYAALSILRKQLGASITFTGKSRGAVSAILGTEHRSYMTLNPLPEFQPDFHLPAHFLPFSPRILSATLSADKGGQKRMI